jgi:hypothetical protein
MLPIEGVAWVIGASVKSKCSDVFGAVLTFVVLFVEVGDLLEGGRAMEKLEKESISLFVLLLDIFGAGLVKNES